MFSPCSQGIVNITLDLCKNPVIITSLCSRGPGHARRRAEQSREGKSAEFALATERFLDPQTGLALLICRARDIAHTARHARHVTHITQRIRVMR